MPEIPQPILDEFDPGYQARRQVWREKIAAYINGTIRPAQEVVILPGEIVDEGSEGKNS